MGRSVRCLPLPLLALLLVGEFAHAVPGQNAEFVRTMISRVLSISQIGVVSGCCLQTEENDVDPNSVSHANVKR